MLTILQATLLLIFSFLIGITLHLLLRAGYAYRSQVSSFPSRRLWFRKNWDTILIRTFFNSLLFWGWIEHPDWISKVVNATGINPNIGNWITVPVSLGTAALFGFFVDVVLDSAQSIVARIPQIAWLNTYLRGQIPSYDGSVVNIDKIQEKEKEKENGK